MARQRRSGFTLIELMVAMLVLSFVTFGVLGVFSDQKRGYVAQKRMVDTQEDARLVGDIINADLRMGGFMVPDFVAMTSADGGTSGADRLCTSDPSIISAGMLALVNVRFDGAQWGTDVGASEGSVDIPALEQDIDGDGNRDFSVGSGIIIADGTKSHCARVTTISNTRIGFTPDTPSGFSATATSGRAVPAIVYEQSGLALNRNNLLLSQGVEDVQIEFAIDANDDGQIGVGEFPIHDIDGFDPSLVRAVRLSILTRTSQQDESLTASGVGRQAVANRAAGSADAFRRRIVQLAVAPRNLL